MGIDEETSVSVEVTNTGMMAGEEGCAALYS
jgi:hypothetical protein